VGDVGGGPDRNWGVGEGNTGSFSVVITSQLDGSLSVTRRKGLHARKRVDWKDSVNN